MSHRYRMTAKFTSFSYQFIRVVCDCFFCCVYTVCLFFSIFQLAYEKLTSTVLHVVVMQTFIHVYSKH